MLERKLQGEILSVEFVKEDFLLVLCDDNTLRLFTPISWPAGFWV